MDIVQVGNAFLGWSACVADLSPVQVEVLSLINPLAAMPV